MDHFFCLLHFCILITSPASALPAACPPTYYRSLTYYWSTCPRQVLDRDVVNDKFRRLTADLSRALDALPLAVLDVSDEVREQVIYYYACLPAKLQIFTHSLFDQLA